MITDDIKARMEALALTMSKGGELTPEEWAFLLSDGREAEPSTFGWAALLLQTIAQAPCGAAGVGVLAAALTAAIHLGERRAARAALANECYTDVPAPEGKI